MNKHGFVKAIAEKSGLTMKDAETALGSFIKVAIKTLSTGEDVSIVGFGSFSKVVCGIKRYETTYLPYRLN